MVPRSEIAAALAAVMELAPPIDEDADEVWRVELVKRYATVRPFVPLLTEVIRFGAVEGGQTVLKAVRGLGELLGRKKVKADEVVTSLVTGTWKRLVFGNPEVGRGLVDHRAYSLVALRATVARMLPRSILRIFSWTCMDRRAAVSGKSG